MTNAEWMIENGKKMSGLVWAPRKWGADFEILHNDGRGTRRIGTLAPRDAGKGGDPRLAWLDMERGAPPPPLTEAEDGYLRMVMAPWRERVADVSKQDWARGSRIVIRTDDVYVELPSFEAGTMYRGMEPGRWYKPEELGLWA